jgi:hypothetical protein
VALVFFCSIGIPVDPWEGLAGWKGLSKNLWLKTFESGAQDRMWRCHDHMQMVTLLCRVAGRHTQIPQEILEEYINELSQVFTPEAYNLFTNNCNNFSNELATFLTGQPIPVSPSSSQLRFHLILLIVTSQFKSFCVAPLCLLRKFF